MRTIGRRSTRPISPRASAELLKQGGEFNAEIHRLPSGDTTWFPRGVYRYASHEESNRHWMEAVIIGMAKAESARDRG